MTKDDCITITIGRNCMPTWFHPIILSGIRTTRQRQGSIMVLPWTGGFILFVQTRQLIADTFREHWMIKAVCASSRQPALPFSTEERPYPKNILEMFLYVNPPGI